jgi:protein SCO1/2
MIRTVLACLVLLLGAYAAADAVTAGFQAWTAEDARRIEVARHPVHAPRVRVEGPGVAEPDLHALLAGGRHVTVVEFFYTQCESVCLALGSSFQQMQRSLQQTPADVRLLSISFDPARDTPRALGTYAARMRADAAHWRFVRVPDAAQTRELLRRFQVVVVPVQRDFEHNAALLVVDQAGRLVRVFDLAEQQLALDYARHLAAAGVP